MKHKTPVHFFLVCLGLLYGGIYLGVEGKIEPLKQELQAQRSQALEMVYWDKKLAQLRKHQEKGDKALTIKDIADKFALTEIGKQITESNILSDKEWHCKFANVNFDLLMEALLNFARQEAVDYKDVSIRRLEKQGEVEAELVITL